MPTVPTYDGPQVRAQPLRPVQQQDVDVSGGLQAIARGVGQAGEAFDRIAERNATVKAEQVDTQITTEWMKWDAENRRKYQGENAAGYSTAAEEWWKKAGEDYGKDLDPRARMMASRSLVRKQGTAMGGVAQYVAGEQERHADNVSEGAVTSAVQFGVSTGDTAGSAEQIRSLAAAKGARKGWTTEQVQAEQLKNLSALHLAYITKMADANPDAAQAYYDKNKIEINATAQPRVEEVLKKEADNKFAVQFAAQQASKPLSEQLAAAGEIKDPTRREKALVEIKTNHALVEASTREREKQFSDQAWQLVGQGRKVPESVLSQMDGKERVQLQEHIANRAERLSKQAAVKTDMATYIDLREKLAKGEPVRLQAYAEKIAMPQMEQLLDLQSKAKAGGAKQDGMMGDEARIGNALTALKIDKKKDPDTAAQFTMEVDRRVREASAAKGDKQLSPTEKQEIVDGVAKDTVYVKGFFGSTAKPAALVKPDELADTFVNVPVLDAKGNQVMDGKSPQTKRQSLAEIPQWFRARSLKSGARTEQDIAEDYNAAKAKGLIK